MRKFLFLSLMALSFAVTTQAQRQDYFRFGIGTDFTDAYGAEVEYGMSFVQWLETGLSLGLHNSLPLTSDHMEVNFQRPNGDDFLLYSGDKKHWDLDGKLNVSLLLMNRIDLVRLFAPRSRHGFKVGVGLGVSFYNRMTTLINPTQDCYAMRHHIDFGFDYSLMAAYEFSLTPKLSLGVSGEYLSVPELGLFGLYVKRAF